MRDAQARKVRWLGLAFILAPILILILVSIAILVNCIWQNGQSAYDENQIKIYEDVDYSSLSSIVLSLIEPAMTDKEKCTTLWLFVSDTMYHDKPPVYDWDTSVTYTMFGNILYTFNKSESSSLAIYG